MRRTDEVEVDSEGTWAISYGDMVTLLLTFFIVFFSINPNEQETEYRNGVRMALLKHLQGQEDHSVAYDQGNHILVEFPGISFFDSGKIEMTAAGRTVLQDFIKTYLPYAGQYKVGIRAFTDHKKIDPRKNHRFKDNLELSALRSISTMRILQGSGIPLERIQVGGYGELTVTAEELAKISSDIRAPASTLDLARKIVLVIQPEVL
ncbi:flagellar motor protein MotB [Bdellovibrio sp.]|uniref:OmpA/MotB family protein n=1 Tax=Bdellovibrio TaxID=958 RepID=UPI0032218CCC